MTAKDDEACNADAMVLGSEQSPYSGLCDDLQYEGYNLDNANGI